jgi:hypothetical protein
MRRLLGVCPAGLRRVNQHRIGEEQPAQVAQ